jgi:hypothetical protein
MVVTAILPDCWKTSPGAEPTDPPFAAQRMGHPGLHRAQPDARAKGEGRQWCHPRGREKPIVGKGCATRRELLGSICELIASVRILHTALTIDEAACFQPIVLHSSARPRGRRRIPLFCGRRPEVSERGEGLSHPPFFRRASRLAAYANSSGMTRFNGNGDGDKRAEAHTRSQGCHPEGVALHRLVMRRAAARLHAGIVQLLRESNCGCVQI